MPPKTPIWKSIGRTRNRLDLPLPPIACPKMLSKKIRGHRIARKMKKDELRDRRKGDVGGKYIVFILERGGDQRSFKLRPCGAKIATSDNRFQNGLPSYRHAVCLSSFSSSSPHPPTLPPTRRRFPSLSYFYLYFRFIIVGFHVIYLRSFVYFISDSAHRYTDLCDSYASPLHGLLTSTRSGSPRLSRHNSSPLHKRS